MSTIDFGHSLSRSKLSNKLREDKAIMKRPIKRTQTINSYGQRSFGIRCNSPEKSSKESTGIKDSLKYNTLSASKHKEDIGSMKERLRTEGIS